MPLQQVIMLACVGLGLTAGASFVLLVVLYALEERRRKAQLARTDADKSEITILFQTMRDVVGQQKDLAKQFNNDLDAKMGVVKQILAQSLDKNKKLYEQQRALAADLEDAKAQMQAMQQELEGLRGLTPGNSAPRKNPPPATPKPRVATPETPTGLGFIVPDVPEPITEAPSPTPPAPAPAPAPVEPMENVIIGRPRRGEKRPSPESIRIPNDETLAGTGLTRAQYQKWIGDALDQASVREEEEVEPPAPIAPEDASKARDAFRALLDLERQQALRGVSGGQEQRATGGNGAQGGAAVQQRILEYHDAGMTVSQIARELGIGKGEVRLMISLAQQERA
jgi:hypothetical protein